MCGIFGFMLKKPIGMVEAFKLLKKLEIHQYSGELKPVGGYGAGVAVLQVDGQVILEKVGQTDGSPARQLSEIAEINEASVLIGHVRMPSPQFKETVMFKETAQPYLACCYPDLKVVSAHNGNIVNYKEIREKLSAVHAFESEKVQLIDSEIVPHLFEELLEKKAEVKGSLEVLFSTLKGSNVLSLLQIVKERVFLHFIHKGKTRGLTIWTNEQNEVIFCSRREPLMGEFGNILVQGEFREKVLIRYHEDVSLKLSFPLAF